MTATPHPVDVAVGARIRDRRIALGYNQTDLAKALGLTFQQVQKYEKGANRVSCSKLVGIADFLGVSPAFFLEGLARNADGSIAHPAATTPQERRLMAKISLLAPRTIGILADLASALAEPQPEAT